MHLRVDLEKRFKQELDHFEESLQMPYVTSVERIAKAEGTAAVLLKQLAKRWGPLSTDVQQHIRSLTFEQLAALGEALLDFRSTHDLDDWLGGQATSDNGPETTDQDS
jgi:hypothetical protein